MSCYRTRKNTQHPTGIARQSYATNLDPFVRLLSLVEVRLCLPVAAKHGLVLHTDADVSRASGRDGQHRGNSNEYNNEPLTFPITPVPCYSYPNQWCVCIVRVFD